MATTRLAVFDYDEARNSTASYMGSGGGGTTRFDVILPKESKTYFQQVLDVFLPAGYPHSVTEDYIHYQIYDSLQAFSSSIAGLLSSRAVLEGVGVGDANASPTAALLLSVLQQSMGRLATILFAHKLGTSLEPECKMYRLAADILNDTAMVLDCLSPAFPKTVRVLVLSFSSVLRALCGVCAGSSKASLSAHFAKEDNLGELNAKDSSQETVISLLGMLAGSLVISHLTSPLATWTTLLTLLAIHLATNYLAVSAVALATLNRQRANIVLATALETGTILRPKEAARTERVFERDGVLRWATAPAARAAAAAGEHGRAGPGTDAVLGHARIGVSFAALLDSLPGVHMHPRTRARETTHPEAQSVMDLLGSFRNDAYVLWWDDGRRRAVVALKRDCTPVDQLRAWAHALVVAKRAHSRGYSPVTELLWDEGAGGKPGDWIIQELVDARREMEARFGGIVEGLRAGGWEVGRGCLETRTRVRIAVLGDGAARQKARPGGEEAPLMR